MKKERLKELYLQLKSIVTELESEIYSDPELYTLNIDYSEVLKYEEVNDDDSDEGL